MNLVLINIYLIKVLSKWIGVLFLGIIIVLTLREMRRIIIIIEVYVILIINYHCITLIVIQ